VGRTIADRSRWTIAQLDTDGWPDAEAGRGLRTTAMSLLLDPTPRIADIHPRVCPTQFSWAAAELEGPEFGQAAIRPEPPSPDERPACFPPDRSSSHSEHASGESIEDRSLLS
jgi:hypothetical protein